MDSHARTLALALSAALAVAVMPVIPWLTATAQAHDPGLSSSVVTLSPDGATATLRVHEADLVDAQDVVPADVLVLGSGRDTVRASRADRRHDGERDTVFALSFSVPPEAVLEVRVPLLERLPRGHKHHVEVRTEDGALVASAILSPSAPTLKLGSGPYFTQPEPGSSSRRRANEQESAARKWGPDPNFGDASAWLAVGLQHILEGYDHLLFVFALLLGAATFGASVRLITAFTVGHSISLALAATGVVAMPASIVEPGIAASIVVVALLGLAGRGSMAESLLLTFAFGLLHGLGFASALAETGIAAGSLSRLLASVFFFNVGVEAGQLAFAGAALPLILLLRRRPGFGTRATRLCSFAVAACGVFWFVERVSGG